MKKLITLLLVLVMALSLSACGGSQTADTSEEPQESEESAEATETTDEEDVPSEDLISIESVSIDPSSMGNQTFNLDVKIKNLTNEKKDAIYADVQMLDKNGDVIETESVFVNNVQPGQVCAGNDFMIFCPLEDVDRFSFFAYSFAERMEGASSSYITSDSYDFIKPVEFSVADLITEAKDESKEEKPGEDLVGVEEIKLTQVGSQTELQAKIRNLSDEPQKMIIVEFQALDENGDIIATKEVFGTDIAPGQASTVKGFRLICAYDQIRSVIAYKYYFGDDSSGITGDAIRFNEPVTFTR